MKERLRRAWLALTRRETDEHQQVSFLVGRGPGRGLSIGLAAQDGREFTVLLPREGAIALMDGMLDLLEIDAGGPGDAGEAA